mmetsp:Transcript_29872/g.93360  ORF Transcript_29872/g.93360 Transcript_29872/m.93360 type:complete len:649 (+) Transcript_29872:88-2034(+)
MAAWKRKAEAWPASGWDAGVTAWPRAAGSPPPWALGHTQITGTAAAGYGAAPWRQGTSWSGSGSAGGWAQAAALPSSRPPRPASWGARPAGWQQWAEDKHGDSKQDLQAKSEEKWAPAAPKKIKPASSGPPPPFQRAFLDQPEDLSDEDRRQTELLRSSLEVSVEGPSGEAFAPLALFEELEMLPPYALQALMEMDITAPMPIQAQALPIILGGHDLIGIAKTGSGKTLAYLLPAVVHIEAQKPLSKDTVTPIALIMAPTRELAVQISEEADKLLKKSAEGNHRGGIWPACVYGGKHKMEQLRNLWRGCHVLVATPGRLMDLLQHEELSLSRVTYFVLDEADRMLDFGFQDDVGKIASSVRSDRHMLFFSATWPTAVQDLAKTLCRDGVQPVRLSVGQHEDGVAATRADIAQEVVVFDQDTWEERDQAKRQILYGHLRRVLQSEDNKALVFVNNKSMADEMRDKLFEEGFKTDSMHGGRPQSMRMEVLDAFKRGETRLLVATDVMGRGLDIPEITHVVIYDMGDVDDYIHRIGRTARGLSGVGGHALTLFEYNQKWPELAGGLVQVLAEAGQRVPPELKTIADEVAAGERRIVERGEWKKRKLWKEDGASWQEGGAKGWGGGDGAWSDSNWGSKGNGWQAWSGGGTSW